MENWAWTKYPVILLFLKSTNIWNSSMWLGKWWLYGGIVEKWVKMCNILPFLSNICFKKRSRWFLDNIMRDSNLTTVNVIPYWGHHLVITWITNPAICISRPLRKINVVFWHFFIINFWADPHFFQASRPPKYNGSFPFFILFTLPTDLKKKSPFQDVRNPSKPRNADLNMHICRCHEIYINTLGMIVRWHLIK